MCPTQLVSDPLTLSECAYRPTAYKGTSDIVLTKTENRQYFSNFVQAPFSAHFGGQHRLLARCLKPQVDAASPSCPVQGTTPQGSAPVGPQACESMHSVATERCQASPSQRAHAFADSHLAF